MCICSTTSCDRSYCELDVLFDEKLNLGNLETFQDVLKFNALKLVLSGQT